MKTNNVEEIFCLNNYLPKDLICDISLSDTDHESNKSEDYSYDSPNSSNPYDRMRMCMPILDQLKQNSSTNPRYSILLNNAINELRMRNQELSENKKKKKTDLKLSEFLKTQKGSRIYQRKVKKFTTEEIDELLEQLDGLVADLLVNVYGNYFCQKLFTTSNSQQKRYILENVNIKLT
jgi:hypothetical protein